MRLWSRGKSCELSQSSRTDTVSHPERLNGSLMVCLIFVTTQIMGSTNIELGERRHAMLWLVIFDQKSKCWPFSEHLLGFRSGTNCLSWTKNIGLHLFRSAHKKTCSIELVVRVHWRQKVVLDLSQLSIGLANILKLESPSCSCMPCQPVKLQFTSLTRTCIVPF